MDLIKGIFLSALLLLCFAGRSSAEKKAFVESVTDIALKAQRVAPGDADKPHLGEET